MSTVKEIVSAALLPVMTNTWSIELPPNPMFPALVFTVETTPEEQWCMGGGYDQHEISVVILSKTQELIDSTMPQVRSAFEALPTYMVEEAGGDVDYEDDPDVYGYAMTFRLRTPRY